MQDFRVSYDTGLFSDPLFLKSYVPNYDNQNNKCISSPPWADNEWNSSKKAFFRSRDKVKRSPSESNLRDMSECRRNYKTLTRRNQFRHARAETQKLINAKHKNVKLYWKLLSNKSKSNSPCPISTAEWYNHFLNLRFLKIEQHFD